MARGRPPKPDDERLRTNSYPGQAKYPVTWDGVTRGPELPLGLPGIKWCTRTIQWWEIWRNSPQATLFIDTDWEFLLDTALLHNELWKPRREAVTGKDGKIKRQLVPRSVADMRALAGEIRQRVEHFGATVHNRRLQGIAVNPKNDREASEAQIRKDAEEAVNYVESLAKEAARLKEMGDGAA